MKFQASKIWLILFAVMLVLGVTTAYFMLPAYQNVIKIVSILSILTVVLGGVFLFNWHMNHRAPLQRLESLSSSATQTRGQAANSLLLEGRLRVLESDLDHLTSIVKDMAAIIETQNTSIEELKQAKRTIAPLRPVETPKPTLVQSFTSFISKPAEKAPPKPEPLQEAQVLVTEVQMNASLSLFLRPVVKLADNSSAFYEALLDANAKNILSDEQSVAWKLSSALHVLRRLKTKSQNSMMMTDVPVTHFMDGTIQRSLFELLSLYKPLLNSLVINLQGVTSLEFEEKLLKNLAPFTALGIKWGVSDVVTCMQASRLKSLALIKSQSIRVIRISSETLAKEDITKLDVERLNSSNVLLVADNVDDATDKRALMVNGIILGQGPSLGAARPVKAEMLAENAPKPVVEELKKAS